MPISTTAACCRNWCARAFAVGSWRRAAPSTCAPTCCRMPEAFRNPRSSPQPAQCGARPVRGHPDLYPGRRRRLAAVVPAGRIRDLDRRDAGRSRTLLECRSPARLGLDRDRIRRRRVCRPAAAPARLGRYRPRRQVARARSEGAGGLRLHHFGIRPMATGFARRRRRSSAVSVSPPRSATPRRARAPCSFPPSRSNAPRN